MNTRESGRARAWPCLGLATLVAVTFAISLVGKAPSAGAAQATTRSEIGTPGLSVGQAVALGLVEGLTEYLPISSTGHLLVTERLLDIGQDDASKEATDSYTVAIQAGAILAVLFLYRRRVAVLFAGLAGRSQHGRQLLFALAAAFVPAAAIGKTLEGVIKERLLSPWPVVVAWLVGGVVILLFSANRQRLRSSIDSLEDLTVRQGLIIGFVQALALWPGMSRSLVTILGGVSVGLSLAAAVEFSFLLGLLTLSAATAYELFTNGSTIVDRFGIATPLLGAAVAAIAAFASVRWMVNWLNQRDLKVFGWYRIGAASVTAVLLAGGVI